MKYIENNKKIYAIACGMVASGYDLYTSMVGDIYNFAQDVATLSLDAHVREWFQKTKTGQVNVNPYWPRGHAVISAVFFVNESGFDIDSFMKFFDESGITDPISKEDFLDWIAELPSMLAYMEEKAAGLWDRYCKLVEWLTDGYEPIINEACKIAKDFFGKDTKELLFAPNPLYSLYATDFVRIGNKIIVIGLSCDVESMLHESLHVEVAKYRDKISAFTIEHWHGNFADTAKMIDLGYINHQAITHVDDYKPAYARVIEECFVRGISTVLAGGGVRRLSVHANNGFGSVPAIGFFFEKLRPKAHDLGEFITHVLREFI
ncbi:MAG: hypothetical protein FWB91_10260 [Defluviitaleaceae bacterium]|nr:hypothetical protein [Defluviitaleaceae bacterium]